MNKEIYFNPTPAECTQIVFTNTDSTKIKNEIPDLCIKLGISNIRILFTINKLVNHLLDLLKSYPDEIMYQAINSLILYCYCYYSKDESFPSFEQLRSITYAQTFITNDEKKHQERWVSILQEYGYSNTDEFDLVIYEGVKNGYFNEDELYKQADILKQRIDLEKSRNAYRNAWDLFHDSFNDNKNDVVNAIDDAFAKNYKYLSLNDLNSVVSLFRALDESQKADKLIELYLETKKSDLDYLANACSSGFFGETIDSTLKQNIENIFKNNEDEKSIQETLLSIASRNSWTQKEKKLIEQASVDNLYLLLKNNSSQDLRKIIKFGFMLTNDKMREAMMRVRNENALNKLRTNKYFKKE